MEETNTVFIRWYDGHTEEFEAENIESKVNLSESNSFLIRRKSGESMEIEFGQFEEYIKKECICLKCFHRWIDVYPRGTYLRDLTCPRCGLKRYVIGTGDLKKAIN